ncbi:MAG: MFS transporter, partial [Candidatus Binatota bacterium]
MLGLYLDAIGLDTTAIGWIFTAALAGGAVMTVVLTAVADTWGRRSLLALGALLMALAGLVFAATTNPILLAVAAIFGTISPSGKEVGPFLSIEQAILPQTTHEQNRTAAFSAYNLVGSLSGALGALAVGLPSFFSLAPLTGYRLLVWGYVVCAILMLVLFAFLSPAIEVKTRSAPDSRRIGIRRSRGTVAKLAALFALDAFAGGFIVQSLVAYWFYLRYKTDINVLGAIFFGANLLSALSFLAAPTIARRIGLLNTMVFTHLPSNFLLLLVPLMPNLELTIVVLLARHLLSQLDVPTRQSYTMAVVDPSERAASAGGTGDGRRR